jgi:hypothetical protein
MSLPLVICCVGMGRSDIPTQVRWSPEDLADFDRARGGVMPRGALIKALCAAFVEAVGEHGRVPFCLVPVAVVEDATPVEIPVSRPRSLGLVGSAADRRAREEALALAAKLAAG